MALNSSTYALVKTRQENCLARGLGDVSLISLRSCGKFEVPCWNPHSYLLDRIGLTGKIMEILLASYTSGTQVSTAVKRHFRGAQDIDPDIADWWCSAGRISGSQRTVEHKVGNTEDSQIGALLIEVDSYREAMDKVGRAVVPLLEISEPVLASTVKKAVEGYRSIEQTTRRLSRMRKLTKTELKGERLEYNPLEHEMLGGHKAGVRRVRVVRGRYQKGVFW